MRLLTRPLHLLLFAVIATVLPGTGTAGAGDAEPAPLAAQALLLDGQAVGDRIVAVGERGHILISADQGRTWEQRPAPTRATLTSVVFVDTQRGWAAGHDAVILRTVDGGATWQKVHEEIESGPILDLWFRDETTGYAVGAYGLLLTTSDGGTRWSPATIAGSDDAAADLHLNQLRAFADNRLVIAAEGGHLFLSPDGRQWQPLPSPYAGSLFGTLPLGDRRLLAFGLRGHLFHSADAGRSWQAVATGTEAILNDAIQLRDGRVVVVGLGGTVLVSADGGAHFASSSLPDRTGLTRVIESADRALILLGTHGARRLDLAAVGGTP